MAGAEDCPDAVAAVRFIEVRVAEAVQQTRNPLMDLGEYCLT
jgi:hypothetical protein